MFVELDFPPKKCLRFPEIIMETTNEIFVLGLDHLKESK